MAKCDVCQAKESARTAAGPPMMDGPPADDGGGDIESRLASIEERLAALEDQAMASAVASLDSMPVAIAQYVS